MVQIGSICCEKFKQNIVARTVALIAPVCHVLLRVSCNSKIVPNGPKRKEMHQNMILGCNVVDRECLLQKILTRHRGTNFCINCTSLARFAASFVQQQNGPKCTRTERNAQKHEFRVQWWDRERSLRKILTRRRGTNFCINCTSLARFAASFVLQQNGPKCTQTERNTQKHEFRVQWCGSGVFVAKNSNKTSWHELLH